LLYTCNRYIAMKKKLASNRSSKSPKTNKYVVNPSIQLVEEFRVPYQSGIQKLERIRGGMPYSSVEILSNRAEMPVKRMLEYLGLPQTTYNKRKREGERLSTRDSELLISLYELLEYGLEVFNHEHKSFDNWLRKPNASLGGHIPESLFDTYTGMQEVRSCLQKIDFGNFA
jgi:putative toxin-antitoxin system antitoxin component (TIGR02293 family)